MPKDPTAGPVGRAAYRTRGHFGAFCCGRPSASRTLPGAILGPLIIWFIYKDRSAMVRHASAGAFNFNVSFWVVNVLALILAFVTFGIGLVLAIPVWLITFVVAAIAHIKGALRASRGERYEYPFQIRILS